MGYLRFQITSNLKKKFSEMAYLKYGRKKGALSMAAERAFEEWIYENEH